MVALQVSVYPTVRDDSGFADLTRTTREVLKELFGFGGAEFDYTSPAGYLGIELFSLMVPLLLIIAAVATGAAAIAGEEERGTLDLLLSLPLTRRRVTAEKLGAMAARGDRAGPRAAGRAVDRRARHRHGASRSPTSPPPRSGRCCWPWASAPSRCSSGPPPAAAGSPSACRRPSPWRPTWSTPWPALVSQLETAQRFTPFYHYSSPDPLRNGFSGGHTAALLVVVVVASVAALVVVDRRDLGS